MHSSPRNTELRCFTYFENLVSNGAIREGAGLKRAFKVFQHLFIMSLNCKTQVDCYRFCVQLVNFVR